MATYEQPGRTTTTDKDGKRTLTVIFVGSEEASAPTGVSGTLRSKTVTTDVAGQIKTQFQYELDSSSGTGGTSQSASIVQVEIVAAAQSQPIESHEFYARLEAKEFKAVRDWVQNPAAGDTEVPDSWSEFRNTGKMTNLALKLLRGITSYYSPSIVVRKTYQASSAPSSGQVGKFANPGVSVPGLPNGANFILQSVSARGSQGAFTVTEEYLASGRGGWDRDLYS